MGGSRTSHMYVSVGRQDPPKPLGLEVAEGIEIRRYRWAGQKRELRGTLVAFEIHGHTQVMGPKHVPVGPCEGDGEVQRVARPMQVDG